MKEKVQRYLNSLNSKKEGALDILARYAYIVRYIAYAVVMLIGLILFFKASEGAILRELGVVLFITAFVTATVGELSLWFYTRELAQRLTIKLRRIFNDRRLLRMLDETIFDPDFVRPWYGLTLTLEPLKGYPDFLKVSVKNEYEVKNVSGGPKRFGVEAWLDDILRPNDEAGFYRFKWGSPGEELTGLAVEDYESKEGGRISLKKETHPLEHEESYCMSIAGVQIMRRKELLVFHLIAVTGQLDLRIELSGELSFDTLDVHPRALHHIDHEEFMKTCRTPNDNVREYTIAHVLLPYQGVEVRWTPNE